MLFSYKVAKVRGQTIIDTSFMDFEIRGEERNVAEFLSKSMTFAFVRRGNEDPFLENKKVILFARS